jgi:hypothetical protein
MSNSFVSWLKKAGQDIVLGLEYVVKIGEKILPIVQKDVVPAAEMVFPAYAPLIAEGSDVLTKVAKYVVWLENGVQSFLGTASSLEQRMSAIIAFVQQGLQQWFAANFPGSAEVADKTMFNSGVASIGRGISDLLASVKDAARLVASLSAAELGKDALTSIVQLVQWAEFTAPALLGDASKTGPQKAASIATEVQSVLTSWLGAVSIADQTKFNLACSEIQQGAVDIVNSLKPTTKAVQAVKIN